MKGRKSETGVRFRYWDMGRRGMTQSEIAGEFGVSRQAVNRAIGFKEMEVMERLMGTARSLGALVEWSDASRGALIGMVPQLGGLPLLLVIDFKDRIRAYFDQSKNEDRTVAAATTDDLRNTLRSSLGIDIRGEATFKTVLRAVYEG